MSIKAVLFFAKMSLMINSFFKKSISTYFTLTFIVLISTAALWLPFFPRISSLFGLSKPNNQLNFLSIYKNYDGPLYIVAGKSLYNPKLINALKLEMPENVKYFAAHLPFYPLMIRLFSPFFGYLKSMLFVNLLFTILLVLFFYYLIRKFDLTRRPFLLLIVFLFLPRFLVVRSIGAPESMFILFILLALFFFEKSNYLWAGIFGALAVSTKTPGILLLPAFFLVILEKLLKNNKDFNWRFLYLLLILLGLLAVFGLYWKQYGDFLAYFHSGNNIHLVSPFSVFNFQKNWVGTAWLEDVIFYFFLYLLTVLFLKNTQHRSFFYFSLVFFIALIFVEHRDIARYSLPLWPMSCIAYGRFFTSKKFLLSVLILLPAIYLYAWDFLAYNVMPIADWKPFL